MRRIIFLNRYFFPDQSATSQLLGDLAFHLAATGQQVLVVTGRQRYDGSTARLSAVEEIGGVHVHRIAATRFRRSILGRSVDYASLYVAMWRAALRLAGPGDIVVAKTDPPLLCVPAMIAARRRGARLVNWIQDLYPEIAVQLGMPLFRGRLAIAMLRMRDAALRAAAVNVVVGHRMADRLRVRGIADERIVVIPNWCDDKEICPAPLEDNPLRAEWGLAGRFVVGYSGNLGRAHEFATMLGAAEHLRDRPDIAFLLIGGGSGCEEMRRQVAKRDLQSAFLFLPYQQRAALKHSLAVPDIHWLSLQPGLDGLVVPSKLYGIAAAGRPMIVIAGADSEIAALIMRHQCGLVFQPGESEALAQALRALAGKAQRLAEMGNRARAMLDERFTRRQALARWSEVLQAIE